MKIKEQLIEYHQKGLDLHCKLTTDRLTLHQSQEIVRRMERCVSHSLPLDSVYLDMSNVNNCHSSWSIVFGRIRRLTDAFDIELKVIGLDPKLGGF